MASETDGDPVDDFIMNSLASNVSTDDLGKMKKLCKGDRILPEDELENMSNAGDLFPRLKGKGNWAKNDVEFLVDLLTKSERVDLAMELQQYCGALKLGEEKTKEEPLPPTRRPSETPDYDAYVSFADPDNNSYAQPLVTALKSQKCGVYLDNRNSSPSPEVRDKLTHILIKSKILIFIISEKVVNSGYWSKEELGSYLQLGIPIFPIWIGVTKEQVKKFSPYLAGVLANCYGAEEQIKEEVLLSLAKTIKEKADCL
ncbi:NAD(+) hydrolase PdTIR-like [Glandiceps talaboti]